MDISHHDIQTNGVRLHVAACGPENGALVILLHGFPEYWGAWEVHMRRLAEEGYRVLAPDQRGYNTSEKPPRIRDYALEVLAADIVGLMDHHQRQQARVVGHDWGGAVAWQLARAHGDRVHQVVVVNCPPLDVMQKFAFRHPFQLVRSWYMMVMQCPWFVEWAMTLGDFWFTRANMRSSSRTGTFDGEKLDGHADAWSQPGALGAMVNWYRAGFWHPPKSGQGPVEVPALLLWGEGDRFLGKGLVDPTMAICKDGRAVRYPDNSHWLPHEEPEAVLSEMIGFFEQATG